MRLVPIQRDYRQGSIVFLANDFRTASLRAGNNQVVCPFGLNLLEFQAESFPLRTILCIAVFLIEDYGYGLSAPVQRPKANSRAECFVVFIYQRHKRRQREEMHFIQPAFLAVEEAERCAVLQSGFCCPEQIRIKRRHKQRLCIIHSNLGAVFLLLLVRPRKRHAIAKAIRHSFTVQPVEIIGRYLVVGGGVILHSHTSGIINLAVHVIYANILLPLVFVRITGRLECVAVSVCLDGLRQKRKQLALGNSCLEILKGSHIAPSL